MKSNITTNALIISLLIIIFIMVIFTVSLLTTQSQPSQLPSTVEVLHINKPELDNTIWYYGNNYGSSYRRGGGGWADGWGERYYHGRGPFYGDRGHGGRHHEGRHHEGRHR